MLWPTVPAIVCAVVGTTVESQALIVQLSATDRSVQAAAVQGLTDVDQDIGKMLIQVWNETDRFDVRDHIVRVAGQHGIDSVPLLIELSLQEATKGDQGVQTIIAEAMIAVGPEIVPLLIREAGRNESQFLNAYLSDVLQAFDRDVEAVALEFYRSSNPVVRLRGVRLMDPRIPIERRSLFLCRAAKDESHEPRRNAAYMLQNPLWTESDRKRAPGEFARFTDSLVSLLGSDDPIVVQQAALALILHNCSAPQAVDTLQSIFWDQGNHDFQLRSTAMRAFLAVHESRREAIQVLIRATKFAPAEASVALQDVDPGQIPEHAIRDLIQSMPDVPVQYAEQRYLLLARFGNRAVEPLIEALEGEDSRLSGYAAGALTKIGPDAVEASPAIVNLYGSLLEEGASWQSIKCLDALVAVSSVSDAAKEMLEQIIAQEDRELNIHLRLAVLARLLQERGEEDWVRSMIHRVMSNREHQLYDEIGWRYPEYSHGMWEPDQASISRVLLETSARDAAWSRGREFDLDSAADVVAESSLRDESLKKISVFEQASDVTIDALVDVLGGKILNGPDPRAGVVGVQEQRAIALQSVVWDTEFRIAKTAGRVLAKHLVRQPERVSEVLDLLQEYPCGLMILASSDVDDSPGGAVIQFPEQQSSFVLEALLPYAEKVTPFQTMQAQVVRALGLLRTEDTRRFGTLLRLVRFGAGDRGPAAALASMGNIRPLTPEILGVVREHLDDPRWSMRSAAISAAGSGGAAAEPLLEELIEIGRSKLGRSAGTTVFRAVQQIAPEHPLVIEYCEDYRTYLHARR